MTTTTVSTTMLSTRSAVISAAFGLFAGSLLANGVPHTLFGLTGATHTSPFGTSPTTNLLWGLANLLVGAALVLPRPARRAAVSFVVAAAAGILGTAVSLLALWS